MKKEETIVFRSKTPQRVTKNNINDVIDSQLKELEIRFENMGDELEGSNWNIKSWSNFRFDIFKTRPLRAGSYIPTPERYSNAKCGLTNIRNNDQECFRWCMRYHQSPKGKHDDRTTVLSKQEDKYNYDGISYPTTYDDINNFQDNNEICIFVYTIDENDDIVCDSAGNTEYIMNDLIYLLRVEDKDQSHDIYVKHIDRILNTHKLTCHKNKAFCPICQQKVVITKENDDDIEVDKFRQHLAKCYKFAKGSTLIKLPEE